MRKMKIPGKEEWKGWEEDLDVKYAHKLLYEKSLEEVIQHFERSPIERADELLFMPRQAFQYYVFAFCEFLNTKKAEGESDVASPFLRLIVARENRDPGSVAEIYEKLLPTIDFVVNNQEYFDADYNIYGSFEALGEEIKMLCNKYNGKNA